MSSAVAGGAAGKHSRSEPEQQFSNDMQTHQQHHAGRCAVTTQCPAGPHVAGYRTACQLNMISKVSALKKQEHICISS
jgi:hypothetical protein